ncbi:hypothetical protein HYFRA_00004006, partial [Hymenoscyphus fraxineus]
QSIRNFFAPKQPVKTTTPDTSSPPSPITSKQNVSAAESGASLSSSRTLSPFAQDSTSSSTLSPPPPSNDAMDSPTPAQDSSANVDSSAGRSRIIKSSDDEDEDSDSSLEDLSVILGKRSSAQSTYKTAPGTPPASRFRRGPYNFHLSPLPVQTKYKFDMKSLIKQAEKDEATEASAKRIKAMVAAPQQEAESRSRLDPAKGFNGALLESVVAGKEDGGMQKVQRALMRTEATTVEKCWYFFDAQNPPKVTRQAFPSKAVSQEWKGDLRSSEMRHHTFVSGFAEDMISYGKLLPDEIFLWILDEACHEQEDALRTAYYSILQESTQQIQRLLTPKLVEANLRNIGGTSTATDITKKIKQTAVPVGASSIDYEWAPLRSLIRFYQQVAQSLKQESRQHLICSLLRVSADKNVCKSVDLLDLLQATIRRLCKYTGKEAEWEHCCQNVCKSMLDAVESATLRLQIVQTIPSTSPRTHDLRRRLALCFFFKDISYCKVHPHAATDLNEFVDRLGDPDFVANSETDYQELTALVALLDIAVDDGRSSKLDLGNPSIAEQFDEDVDALVSAVRKVMRSIGNPGAAFISRIEAKETLELVSQRFSDTLRTKQKPKLTHFDKPRVKFENFTKEKSGMSAFLARGKGNNLNGTN